MPTKSQRALKPDGVPIEEGTGELLFRARLSRRYGAEAKANLKRVRVRCSRPETRRSSHEQVEVVVKYHGGPNQLSLKRQWMTCG